MKSDFEKLCRKALDKSLDPEADRRIRGQLDAELGEIADSYIKQVMTIIEISDYLQVSVATVEELLGEIPCFELGGQLRFRKESVDEWIRGREKVYSLELLEFNLNKDTKMTTA